jgi:adenine-specific DNA-methyltransferase
VKGNIVEFSEKPISSIPFRAIDWTNTEEITLHESITNTTKQFLETKQESSLNKINELFNLLFSLNYFETLCNTSEKTSKRYDYQICQTI